MSNWQAGKGSKRRPQLVSEAEVAERWQKAFTRPPRDKSLAGKKIRTK